MKLIRFGGVVVLLFAGLVSSACAQNLSVSVDATRVPQKLLHVEEVLPAKLGSLSFF